MNKHDHTSLCWLRMFSDVFLETGNSVVFQNYQNYSQYDKTFCLKIRPKNILSSHLLKSYALD